MKKTLIILVLLLVACWNTNAKEYKSIIHNMTLDIPESYLIINPNNINNVKDEYQLKESSDLDQILNWSSMQFIYNPNIEFLIPLEVFSNIKKTGVTNIAIISFDLEMPEKVVRRINFVDVC